MKLSLFSDFFFIAFALAGLIFGCTPVEKPQPDKVVPPEKVIPEFEYPKSNGALFFFKVSKGTFRAKVELPADAFIDRGYCIWVKPASSNTWHLQKGINGMIKDSKYGIIQLRDSLNPPVENERFDIVVTYVDYGQFRKLWFGNDKINYDEETERLKFSNRLSEANTEHSNFVGEVRAKSTNIEPTFIQNDTLSLGFGDNLLQDAPDYSYGYFTFSKSLALVSFDDGHDGTLPKLISLDLLSGKITQRILQVSHHFDNGGGEREIYPINDGRYSEALSDVINRLEIRQQVTKDSIQKPIRELIKKLKSIKNAYPRLVGNKIYVNNINGPVGLDFYEFVVNVKNCSTVEIISEIVKDTSNETEMYEYSPVFEMARHTGSWISTPDFVRNLDSLTQDEMTEEGKNRFSKTLGWGETRSGQYFLFFMQAKDHLGRTTIFMDDSPLRFKIGSKIN